MEVAHVHLSLWKSHKLVPNPFVRPVIGTSICATSIKVIAAIDADDGAFECTAIDLLEQLAPMVWNWSCIHATLAGMNG